MKRFNFSFKKDKYLAIDVGSYSIKFVVGRYKNDMLTVYDAFTKLTPAGCFEQEKIVDFDKLKETIKTTLLEHNIKEKSAICTIENTTILKRVIILPKVKPEDLKEMVKFEINQYLPIDLNDYVIQFKVIENITENDTEKQKILVAVISKDMIEDYFKLIKMIGLHPIALDINSNAINKMFNKSCVINDQKTIFNKTIAFVDIGHTFTDITIIQNGKYRFNRTVKKGGSDIDSIIAQYHNAEDGVEKRKKIELDRLIGSEQNYGIKEIAATIDENLGEMLKDDFHLWIEEINKIFKYYTTREVQNRIDSICLYGGSSRIEGIERYIESRLYIDTFTIQNINNLVFIDKDMIKDLPSYINAIASLIRL